MNNNNNKDNNSSNNNNNANNKHTNNSSNNQRNDNGPNEKPDSNGDVASNNKHNKSANAALRLGHGIGPAEATLIARGCLTVTIWLFCFRVFSLISTLNLSRSPIWHPFGNCSATT